MVDAFLQVLIVPSAGARLLDLGLYLREQAILAAVRVSAWAVIKRSFTELRTCGRSNRHAAAYQFEEGFSRSLDDTEARGNQWRAASMVQQHSASKFVAPKPSAAYQKVHKNRTFLSINPRAQPPCLHPRCQSRT